MPVPSLDDILGQPRALETLRSALASGKVHHAWVFAGPPGVGKFTTALAFASMLLDPTLAPNLAGELGVDPDSPTRRMVGAGTHPDLHVITKELALFDEDKKVRDQKQITIARSVIEQHLLIPIARAATLRCGSLMNKAFIIDEAELMDRSLSNATTQNSLLKTLEEPPAGSVIILVTANENRLLPTIRSRCQRVVFHPLDERSMSRWLKSAAARDGDTGFGRTPDTKELAWVTRFASGSPGRALLAVRTGLYEWFTALEPMLRDASSGRFPLDMGQSMAKLVGAWAEQWVSEHKNASKEAANHAAVRHLATLLAEHYRGALLDAADRADEPGALGALWAIDRVVDAERHVSANVNMGLALEYLSAGLSQRAPAG